MNVLFVNMSVDPVLGGGTVERTHQLLKEFRKLPNTSAKVLSTTAGLIEYSNFDEAEYILLPCLNERWYLPAPYFRMVYQSIKWSDVIIMIGHWTLINAMVYFTNILVKRPYLFCPAGALNIFGRSVFFKRCYNFIVGTSILKQASRLIAIPNDEQEYFCDLGIHKNRTVCIPNGIDSSDFQSSDAKNFRLRHRLGDAPFLIFMGRLNEIKGPDILLKAFGNIAHNFATWHLVMAGPDGGMESYLRDEILKYNLSDRVHLIGFVSGKEKSDAYHAADLLVVPSRLEAMSIVALEAGSCGTPVLMSDTCGFSEMVDAEAAVEVPANVSELEYALIHLMSNPKLLQEMGSNAKYFINKYYTWEISAKRHRMLCDEVCH